MVRGLIERICPSGDGCVFCFGGQMVFVSSVMWITGSVIVSVALLALLSWWLSSKDEQVDEMRLMRNRASNE